jgi:CYTH domain-containing protein
MFTVELNKPEERVEIYLDGHGLSMLIRSLERLLQSEKEHEHFMTPSWAGNELTEEKQGLNTHLVNHLLIVKKGK